MTLKAANLSADYEQLPEATCALKYDAMREQLRKIFSDSTSASASSSSSPDVNEVDHIEPAIEQTYLSRSSGSQGRPYHRQRFVPRKKQMAVSSYTPQLPSPSHKLPFIRPRVTCTKRGRNPVDTTGQTTRCGICDSINHWARDCPDQPHQSTSAYFIHATADPDVLDINYATNDVTLFQSDFDSSTHLQGLVDESWNHAVFDSGASKTVCGRVWLNTYVACLNVDESRVQYSNSASIFRFGDGRRLPATSTAHIPAYIGNQQLFIDTDVVDEDIPLLLSRPSMKEADMHINFKDDTVQALDQLIPLSVTRSGHYILPLTRVTQLLPKVSKQLPSAQSNITLHLSKDCQGQPKSVIADKIHRQFAHAPADKLIRFLNNAGPPWCEDKELND